VVGHRSALWHLATHDADRRRLVAEPELMPTAVEELLRAYSPVTMAPHRRRRHRGRRLSDEGWRASAAQLPRGEP